MVELIDVEMHPDQQEGTESMVATWLKKPGDPVTLHEPLLEIATDKVVVEISAPGSGRLKEILKTEGERVEPGDILGRIELTTDAVVSAADETVAVAPAPTRPRPEARLSPAVRRLLKQHQLNPGQIPGTGRGGRITYQDVQRFLEARQPPAAETPVQASTGVPALEPDGGPAARAAAKIPHTPMRRRIAAHMVESLLHTAPHVTSVFEADFSAVARHQSQHRSEFESEGVALTYTAYLIFAAARALQRVPEVNSRWHEDYLELLEDCNIGIATALGKSGLIVPVIRKVQRLNLQEIAEQLQRLTQKAREGKLVATDLEGGTFTITNHGVGGSLIATPVIHQPQSAILGVGKVAKRLAVVEAEGRESIQIRPMAYITLTIDHRALDGFTANLFLSEFVGALQQW